jgi:hypothetical protein
MYLAEGTKELAHSTVGGIWQGVREFGEVETDNVDEALQIE